MKNNIFAAACIAAIAEAQNKSNYPSIDVKINGQPSTLYVQYPEFWSEAQTDEDEVTFDWNNRMYLSTVPALDTTKYFKPNLLGGSIEFDVDLSRSGCGCLTALYAIVMPANQNQDDPFKYCDAASVGGHMCPEFDVMEANKHAWRSTAHKCDNSNGYSNCDRNGMCTTDVLLDKVRGLYAPNSISGIDTEEEFHVKQEFHQSGGAFTGYTTILSQAGGRQVVLSEANCSDYLGNMSYDMTQMVIALSNWSSSDFDWLEHGVCEGQCSQTSTWSSLSNLQFQTTTVEPIDPPSPSPTPDNGEGYEYGDDCTNLNDQDCGKVDCAKCSWSWPTNDPAKWSSNDALCRCQIENESDDTPSPSPSPTPSDQYPAITAQVDGVDTQLYVQYPTYWSSATVTDGKELGFDYNNRMYLSTTPELDTSKYFKPNLLGGSIEFDVDLSESGCGCLTALYAIVMPATQNSDDPFQYCDAASVGGHMCPEFDVMEANKYAWRSTAHKCDNNGGYSNCDHNGMCTTDVLLDHPRTDYGPNKSKINTNQPFHVRQDFHESNGSYTGYTTYLTQGNHEMVMSETDCGNYLDKMSVDMTQMVIAISNWGSDSLDWFQHGVCSGSCSQTNTWSSLSNLQFNTNSAPAPTPPEPSPSPEPEPQPQPETVYKYGNKCGSRKDLTLCGDSCEHCHMSWPIDSMEKWRDPEAACRCVPAQRDPDDYNYANKKCKKNTAGLCGGCDDCHFSWPKDDPKKWKSDESMCRCKPQEDSKESWEFGDDCSTLYDMDCGADCDSCKWSWPSNEEWWSDQGSCRCEKKINLDWGDDCANLSDDLCGHYCRECSWSWESSDSHNGSTASCRCKNWWV